MFHVLQNTVFYMKIYVESMYHQFLHISMRIVQIESLKYQSDRKFTIY